MPPDNRVSWDAGQLLDALSATHGHLVADREVGQPRHDRDQRRLSIVAAGRAIGEPGEFRRQVMSLVRDAGIQGDVMTIR